MRLLHDLFTTDVGLFSAIGIAFMLGMGGFFFWLFTRTDTMPKKEEDTSQ
ncbi:hypothetical protein GCM10022279_01430 [Comamonas faecalis]|uniref:DUF3149 domain-containing protein n=1 Tax=Comamonas faecalis TaxID=1387849 RepID=A0ABP7QG38_9BURK